MFTVKTNKKRVHCIHTFQKFKKLLYRYHKPTPLQNRSHQKKNWSPTWKN